MGLDLDLDLDLKLDLALDLDWTFWNEPPPPSPIVTGGGYQDLLSDSLWLFDCAAARDSAGSRPATPPPKPPPPPRGQTLFEYSLGLQPGLPARLPCCVPHKWGMTWFCTAAAMVIVCRLAEQQVQKQSDTQSSQLQASLGSPSKFRYIPENPHSSLFFLLALLGVEFWEIPTNPDNTTMWQDEMMSKKVDNFFGRPLLICIFPPASAFLIVDFFCFQKVENER